MVVVLILTLLLSAWIVSSITTAMTRLSILASQRSSQFSALRRYLSDNGISPQLSQKVQRNAQYAVSEQNRHAPESSIELLALISDPLRCELHYEVHAHVLLVHPFFRAYKDVNPTGTRKICHQAVTPHNFTSGDIVFAEGETPAVPKLYLVARGKLLYVQDDAKRQHTVTAGHWLSEGVLWTDWRHQGTLCALTECRLLSVDAQKFHSILSKFPSINIRQYAVEFCKSLSASYQEDLTDVGREDQAATVLVRKTFPEGQYTRTSTRQSLRASNQFKRFSGVSNGSAASLASMQSIKENVGKAMKFMLWAVGFGERDSAVSNVVIPRH